MVAYTVREIPKWNPINICSYHLQEAGATPVQEIAYSMSTAIAVLDAVRDSGQVRPEEFSDVVARISFFVNAGVRFVEEMCKMRAFVELWDELTRERYGVTDAKARRFRYGVQVNSLGLTEAQPENNVQRIVLEMLAVTLSKDARARAIQLPAWNEALGLPRPWDQQWSCACSRCSPSSPTCSSTTTSSPGPSSSSARSPSSSPAPRPRWRASRRWAGRSLPSSPGYMKSALVASHAERRRRIEAGDDVIVGLNRFETTEPNPLTADLDTAIQTVDPSVEQAAAEAVRTWREQRDADPARRDRASRRLDRLTADAASGANLMAASLECARADVTTGEWAAALRDQFGEYRAPPGSPGPSASAGPSPARRLAASAPPCRARVRTSARSCASSSASPGSTATATAPSRSPCEPATPASRSSTRASGSRPTRSSRPRWPRTCTSWALDPLRLAHGARARGAPRPARCRRR